MLEWSPPRILAVISLAFSAILSSSRTPTFANPYPQQTVRYENIAGGYHEFGEGQLTEKIISENAHSKDRRSPTEDVDNPVSYLPARKRHGIETPIRPLESEAGGTSTSNEEKMASLRSKVDQPEPSNSVGLSTDDNDKISDNLRVSNSESQNKGSESIIGDTEGHKLSDNKPRQSQQTEQTTVRGSEGLDENGDMGKNKGTKVQQQIDTQATQDQHKAEYNRQTQDSHQNIDGQATVNTNNIASKTAASANSIMTSTEERGTIPSDKDKVDSSPKAEGKVNTQVRAKGEYDDQGTSNKIAVPHEGSTNAQKTADIGGSQTLSPEPIRDKLGTSGSEIVTTTHGPYDERLPYYRDTESKPSSSEPEVGNFQVDDKSADLEINANSAGVKVKAKPASLQVVSRPGSHSATSDTPLARSFYQHYRYPPFHRLHHWLPGFRHAFRPFRRHHLFRPYRIYPRNLFPSRHRYDYEPEDVDAPLHRRHSWYPHRRRGHYHHEPYLYERSRTEAPMRSSRYQYDEPFDRRYRRRFHGTRFHRMRLPPRHHLYDRYSIPVTNNFAAPNMNVAPDADTMPQLPLSTPMTEQMMIPPYQRQNIVTPVPTPINLFGNPPASIMNGATFMGRNGMDNFGALSTTNGLGTTNDFAGMTGVNALNGLYGRGNPLEGLDPMAGLNGEMGEGIANLDGTQERRQHLGTTVPEPAGRPVKKAAIQSVKQDLQKGKHAQRNSFKAHLKHLSSKKSKLALQGWEKILKHHHDAKTDDKTHHRSRRTTKLVVHDELRKRKHNKQTNLHAQKSKDVKGNRKNAIIIHRPPIIYHPPPEIYHRPSIVVHRAPIMLHRPPIIYHQPPVVVHRPAIIYHQPPIIFHQPPPVVNQPIMHSHDTYVTKPVVYQTNSVVSHAHTYYGIPSNVYSGTFGCHGAHCAFRKGDVPRNGNITDFTKANGTKVFRKEKRNVQSHFDFIASNEGAQEQLTYISKQEGDRSKRESLSDYYSFLRHKMQPKYTRFSENEIPRKKKKDVVVNRPPIIYHPPPEIYHRPDIVVHRPPLVIHRPPIIYHQPPVIVHRPAVVYHQPPIVFHQPPPAVSQPLLYSHDSFMIHPTMYASHHGSVVRDSGHYVGIPNAISNYGHPLFGMQHNYPMSKRSIDEEKQNILKYTTSYEKAKVKSSNVKDKDGSIWKVHNHPKNVTSEKAGKKNSVLIARPPIIYHPPPEVYHRPVIVVHRAPIMLHRAPIIYHQPPVIVHRPAIVYHQPPLVFHQPPPVVNQPILKSHDTWIRRPVVVPYASHISQHSTYVGVPDSFSTHMFGHYHGHFGHGHTFYKSNIPKISRPLKQRATTKNKIEKTSSSTISKKHHKNSDLRHSLKRKKSYNEKGGKKNAVIVKRPPVIYHPPPEIYHRPDIIIHRAPIMIHRAAIIYHQPPVIVHRPAVVYHQPPLIFHQPPPVVHQTFLKSHDTWVPKPSMRLYSSRVHHAGHMYHIPHAYYYHGHGAVHYMAYGKSKVPHKFKLVEENSDPRGIIKNLKHHHGKQDETDMEQTYTGKKKHTTLKLSKVKTERGAKLHSDAKSDAKHHEYVFHREKETTETGAKKNAVIIHRPPIIYHPPPEVYHRPNIVVHRAPIVLYRPPIIYHQPPVVVHRPAIVYHQPPIVFHQPPPIVHQPVMHAHDTWVTKTVAVPYSTHVHHVLTYHGVPHEAVYMHGIGAGAFVKSHVPPRKSRRDKIRIHETEVSKTSDGVHEIRGKASKAVRADAKIRRAIQNQQRPGEENISDEPNLYSLGARRIARAIKNTWMPFSEATVSSAEDSRLIGAKHRILRALDDLRSTSEGENTRFMHTSNVGKDEIKTGKRTILIIRRPPIIYHPPSHVVHRPSIVVHRQPLLVHRQPLIFRRPPILIRRPPIVIHRPPILFRRPPLFVHRPSLVIHRHPFIIHRAPFIIHHHPIMIHRPPIIIHKSPNFLVQHTSAIHHYPMHMVHVHCPGCGFGKSSIFRVRGSPNDRKKKDKSRSHPHSNSSTMPKYSKVSPTTRPTIQISNRLKPFVSDHDYETAALKINKRETVPGHKKKDVVVNRPPIIYHPPPEVYHRPDIVVHRAPILIHRPPIVYHQPPVVVHRPAVVYHQPPIVFHQPSPAVNQPLLYSHDSFVVHPMAFASHMGSVINDAGHYVGLPHGDINNYPGSLHGLTTSTFSPALSRRGKIEKLQGYAKSSQGNPSKEKGKQADGEKKNKVIVARPPMIYHPPPEIYDRPSVILHRPDLVFHRPSIVYHQPSVVIHRPPVIYRQPPVVFHQPSPMTSQSIMRTMDTYTAQPVFEPHATQVQHPSTYVGIPHFFPGYNNYGWHMNGNMLGSHGQSRSGSGSRGWGYGRSFGAVFGRSKVETATKKNKNGKKTDKSYIKGAKGMTYNKRSAINHSRRSKQQHNRYHKHRHHNKDRGGEKFLGQTSTITHRGHHRSHVMIINRPPLVYRPPTQVIHPPPVLVSLPPVVYQRPPLVYHQPPTVVHHPAIVYHQPSLVFHNPPPIIDDNLNTHMHSNYLPLSSYAHSLSTQYEYIPQNEYTPVVSGQAFSKSKVEMAHKMETVEDTHTIERNKRALNKIWKNTKGRKTHGGHDIIGSKRQYMDLVVNRPPVVFHSPPDIFEKPPVIIPQEPLVVRRPPVLYHPPPIFVQRQPIIYHQAPLVLRHHTPGFHHHHSHQYRAIGFGYGKSIVSRWHQGFRRKTNDITNSSIKSNSRKGEKKNTVLVPRPPMIYHPPPDIFHKPDVIVHQPDVVIHRPSIMYHQSPVVVHRSSVVYHQPPLMFHQPPPLVDQPVMLAHETYLAHPTPVPLMSQFHHVDTFIGDPHSYGGALWDHAFLKSSLAKTGNDKQTSSLSSSSKRNDDRRRRSATTHTSHTVNTSFKADSIGKSSRKNKVVMLRPPMIYHPPPEIYDKPDVIVHRPDYVIHQPSVVYHQPSVVVHRPPVVYKQPPVVFHQPQPMVHQPIMHAHDTYVAHQLLVPYASRVQNTASYRGTPHFFPGGWNFAWGGSHGFAYGKSNVPKPQKEKSSLRSLRNGIVKRDAKLEKENNKKEGHKKNMVIMHRPPLIYHPPPEIYHRPSIIVHRPDLVIHRPSVVFHQSSVVVHRPPVIYHQPPVVFHQPPPMVHQPILHAHDTYLAHPDFVPYWSHDHHASTYIGAPHSFSGGWGWGWSHGHGDGFGFGHAFGKSKVEKAFGGRVNAKQDENSSAETRRRFASKQGNVRQPVSSAALRNETKKGTTGHKKNMVVMHRPPLIYHPPPEIYHRPSVIVHRPDLVIHRPSIVFHQPPVVVHRPSVIYHQPPIVFHQPPPMVHQPLIHSHDTYMAHPFFSPFLSHVEHAGTYVGAPHEFHGGWGWGHAFGKSKVAKGSKKQMDSENKIINNADIEEKEHGKKRNQRSTGEHEANKLHKTSSPKTSSRPLNTTKRKVYSMDSTKNEANRKNIVIVRRPKLIYHPPAEIYDRPDIIVHRPELVYHQPSIVYHQPSVVVNRTPITYNQPPVVFHQPSPMVNQPIFHERDEYHARPYFVPYASHVQHASSYVGAPHAFLGNWGWKPGSDWGHWNTKNIWGSGAWNRFNGNRWAAGYGPGQHNFGPAVAKSLIMKKVQSGSRNQNTKASKSAVSSKRGIKQKHWPTHHKDLRNTNNASTPVAKKIGATIPQNGQKMESHVALRKEITEGRPGHKKNMVIMRRPTLVYHPPAEVYHRPDVIVHRPDIVIHRPSVVFHQPSVVVHRPPVIYHQPPVVFHQPQPMVHQPILHSHDTYVAHPHFEPFASSIHHHGAYVGAPHYFHGGWGWGWGHGHSFGKSHVPRSEEEIKRKHARKKDEITGQHTMHPERRNTENPAKKNSIVVSRPPIIYHPPPEIYHRPDIVVHRAPIVLRRPPIIYHQPPVVVHRPAVVYHQPPIIFHQPPPVIHQPILHSHDSFVVHPEAHFVPEGSTVSHAMNYVGIPSSVMGQNEFASHFHRSYIEHGKASTRRRTKVPVESKKEIKSTISRIPITHKENTETAITDEAQKKTLRSYIGKMKNRNKKRNKINTNFSLTSVTPFNNVHPAGAMIEQHQKLSNIPRKNYDRQRDIAKRSTGDRRKKRQAFLPAMGNIGYHSSLPSMNNNYALEGFQSQALPDTKALDNFQDEAATHPDNVHYLTHVTGSGYLNAPLFHSSLVGPYSPVTPKQDSPEVHVHVETAKSTIPFSRTRRQIWPEFPVSQMLGPTARFLYSGLENLDPLHSLHTAPQQENYHVVNPYQAIYHPAQTGLAYNPYPSADEHRPRVSINVNSERSHVPLAKRYVKQRTKRQLWSVRSPFPAMFPAPPSQSYFPHSPYSFISASPYHPDPMQSYTAGYGGLYSPYGVDRPFRPSGLNAGYNALLGYLNAIYGAYSRYPPYFNHRRPKVQVDVHTSRSNIQKAKKKSNNSITSASRSKNPTLVSKRHQGNTTLNKTQSHNYSSRFPSSTEHYTLPLSTTKWKRSTKWGPHTGRSHLLSNNKRNELENRFYRNRVGNSERPYNEVLHQSMQRQLVGGNLNAAAFDAEPSVNERSQALSQLNNLALAEQEPIAQQDDTAQNVNQWQVPQAPGVGAPQRLPFESLVNRLPANGFPFPSSVAPYQAQEQQFQMRRAPFPLSFAPFSPTVVPMHLSTTGPLQDLGQDASEQNQGHTSVNVEVTKSSVPKKTNSHHAIPVAEHTSHLRGSVTYKKNVGVHKTRQKPNTKRQKITLLNRMSAMQILPQTFKQNGVNIPSSNTIPINNYMGGNGMSMNGFRNKQGQKKRKNNIPSTTETIAAIKRHYKTPRQPGIKKKDESHKKGEKRQFQSLPIYTLPEAVEPTQLMPANTYETNLIPEHHHVSIHVDTAKKKSTQQWRIRRTQENLSVNSDSESELKNAQKRQIYGLLYLPQEERMQQFSTDGNRLTDNQLIHHSGEEEANLVPDMVQNVQAKEDLSNLSQPVTRISTNVGAAKRNKKTKPEANRGTRSYQNNNVRTEKHQKKADNRRHQTGYKRQFYQTVTEPGNLLLSTGRELPVLEAPSRPQHPRVSVKVEVSKRTSDVTKPNGSYHKGYHATFRRQLGTADQGNAPAYIEVTPQSDLEQNAANNQAFSVFQNEQQQAENAQAFEGNPLGQLREALPQSQPTQLLQSDQELYQVQNMNSKQLPSFKQTPEFQQLSPLHNSRVSINVEAEKKTLPKQPQYIQSGMTVTKRQMFGTVPLLSPVTQPDVHGRIQQQSKVRSTIIQTNQIHNKNKRQLYGIPPPVHSTIDDHAQPLLMGNSNHPFQSDSYTRTLQTRTLVHPYMAMESKPRVNINVQPSKSNIPSSQRSSNTNTKFAKGPFIDYLRRKSHVTPQLPARKNNNKKRAKEVKRQLELMQLGAALERRGSPKPLGSILKKPPGNGRFLLNSNFNKPVDVFATDPVATNIPGIPQGKPKFEDSPIMEDQMSLKAAAQPVGLPLPAEMGPNPFFQNSPPGATPFRQEPFEIGGLPKALGEGIAEPMMAPSPPEVRLLGTDTGSAGLLRRGGLFQVNPFLLTPRVIPIPSDLPAHIPFDDHLQDTESLHLPLEAPLSPLLPPPFLPLPPPETAAFHPQQLQDAAAAAAGQAPDEERPSIHVNVETSKSRIPNRASYWKHKTSSENRG